MTEIFRVQYSICLEVKLHFEYSDQVVETPYTKIRYRIYRRIQETSGYTENCLQGFDCIYHLAWEYLGIPQEELGNVAGERDPAYPAATITQPWIILSKWMDDSNSFTTGCIILTPSPAQTLIQTLRPCSDLVLTFVSGDPQVDSSTCRF